MKKLITLTESDLLNVINKLVESIDRTDDSMYDGEDFIEVFLEYFRPWIRQKHGEEIGKYPMSFLVKKYIKEFSLDKNLNSTDVVSYQSNLANMTSVGKSIVRKGLHELPNLKPKIKFTERYKKHLDFFVQELVPYDFIEVVFEEPTIYEVRVFLKVDWNRLIKSDLPSPVKSSPIIGEIKDKIKNFLGVDLGNPIHGGLRFVEGKNFYDGLDEWIKNDLNKVIKKKIKELPTSRNLHSIKFEIENYRTAGSLKISMRGYSNRSNTVIGIKNLLEEMGYNKNILSVYS